MDASEQSRQPDQPATQATPLTGESSSRSGAALSVRLWRAGSDGQPGDLLWTSGDLAVSLVEDLITAEGGVAPAPRGRFLVAAFPGILPAVLTARRLQWALTGFSEADTSGAAAAVLVHSAADLPALETDSAGLMPLENAAGGQILLTPQAAELLRDLPGLPLQSVSETGLCELEWRASDPAPARASDEEALSRFIQLNGLENEASIRPLEPPVSPTEAQPVGADRGSSALPIATDAGGLVSRLRQRPRLLVISACAAAILLILVVIVAVAHKRTPEPATVPLSQASSANGLESGQGAGDAQPLPSEPVKHVPPASAGAKSGKQTQNDGMQKESAPGNTSPSNAAESQANKSRSAEGHAEPADQMMPTPKGSQPKAANGKCDLDAALLPKMLEQAERSREQGNYPAALRQFHAVLACDPNNARARSGLDMTELAMQHK